MHGSLTMSQALVKAAFLHWRAAHSPKQRSHISSEVTSETTALLPALPISWLALANRNFSLSWHPTDKTTLKGMPPGPTQQGRGGRWPQPLRSPTHSQKWKNRRSTNWKQHRLNIFCPCFQIQEEYQLLAWWPPSWESLTQPMRLWDKQRDHPEVL